MFKKISRIANYLRLKLKNQQQKDSSDQEPKEEIPTVIADIKAKLEAIFSDSSDFNMRKLSVGVDIKFDILIAYIDGLADIKAINNNILKPVLEVTNRDDELTERSHQEIVKMLENNLLSTCNLKEVKDFKKTIDAILDGDTVIYLEGVDKAFKTGLKKFKVRAIAEPKTEVVVRGPREGFTESLRTNTTLLRRKIKNPKLKFETLTLGRTTNTDVALCYIRGLANEDIISTVKRRLKNIKIDAVLSSGYIEEFIEDAPYSIMSTVGHSEKPDVIAGKILEGRVAIICDGTPFVLTVPYLFIETIQANEDYYVSTFFASMTRLIRVISLIITIVLPGLYVALITFHHDVIPLKLLLTIASSREGIPFSAFTETLLMGVTFELLREAGVRMPRPIGQAVSIVGGLVLGQAAVEAGVASNPVIMITAITAITSFVIPKLREVIPILRIIVLIAANILGILGISIILIMLFIHLCTIRSFGIPFLTPLSPMQGKDLKDTWIRIPLWAMWTRPKSIIRHNSNFNDKEYRMKADIKTKED